MITRGAAKSGRLTRREMVQRLLAGVGAGAAWPLVAAGHPIHEHLANGAIFEEAEKLGAADHTYAKSQRLDKAWVTLGDSRDENQRVVDACATLILAAHAQKSADLKK